MIKHLRLLLLPLTLLLLLAAWSATALAEPPYAPQKVVYHFNSNIPQVNAAGLKNIQNHINALGKDNLKVVALVHSAAWEMVASERAVPMQVAFMKSLIDQGVVFKICQNPLNEFKLDA